MVVLHQPFRSHFDYCADSVPVARGAHEFQPQPVILRRAVVHPDFSGLGQRSDDHVRAAVAIEVADRASTMPPGRLRRLLAHPAAPGRIDVVPPGGTAAVVAIGPEGGFTPYEATSMADRGFEPFSLGPRALRVDVAVPFAVGQAEQWLISAARR